MTRSRATLALALFLALTGPMHVGASVRAEVLAEGLDFPTNMAFAPDGRIFFGEKDTGRIRVIEDGILRPEPFVTLPVVTDSPETGLLGLAIDPAFPREPWIYAYYSDATDRRNRVVRIRAHGNAGTERQVLFDANPVSGVHNGGDMAFGPDGKLYVAVGEGGDETRSQNPGNPGGKILRLNRDGSVPADDPLGPENPVFALGIRNSFGLCFDPVGGALWETENGPGSDDEINRIVAGGNYGWPEQLGPGGGPTFVDPALDFPRVIIPTGCAFSDEPVGGASPSPPHPAGGTMFFGDFGEYRGASSDLYRINLGPDLRTVVSHEIVATFPRGITDVAAGPDGALYVATADAIYRLGRGTVLAPSPGEPRPSDGGTPSDGATWALGALILAAFLALTLAFRLRARR